MGEEVGEVGVDGVVVLVVLVLVVLVLVVPSLVSFRQSSRARPRPLASLGAAPVIGKEVGVVRVDGVVVLVVLVLVLLVLVVLSLVSFRYSSRAGSRPFASHGEVPAIGKEEGDVRVDEVAVEVALLLVVLVLVVLSLVSFRQSRRARPRPHASHSEVPVIGKEVQVVRVDEAICVVVLVLVVLVLVVLPLVSFRHSSRARSRPHALHGEVPAIGGEVGVVRVDGVAVEVVVVLVLVVLVLVVLSLVKGNVAAHIHVLSHRTVNFLRYGRT